jgi:hypothetical protein
MESNELVGGNFKLKLKSILKGKSVSIRFFFLKN